jgi:hypothetical protein
MSNDNIRKLMGDDFKMRPIDYVITFVAGATLGAIAFFALS